MAQCRPITYLMLSSIEFIAPIFKKSPSRSVEEKLINDGQHHR